MAFYHLLHPRPVVVIGAGKKDEKVNFMACSWITPISEEPELIGFACYKENYTSELIRKYKKFSVNIVEDIDLIWKVGTSSGRKVDKIEKYNIEIGFIEDVPIIKNSLGYLICDLFEEYELGEDYFFVGKVLKWEGKNFERWGWKEHWRVPLHKGGKAFVFPEKKIRFIR